MELANILYQGVNIQKIYRVILPPDLPRELALAALV